MLVGAVTALVTRQIDLLSAFNAIDWSVIFFLFGMFILGRAFEESGALMHFVRCFKVQGDRKVLCVLIFSMAVLSAIFMNDTVAVVGTSIALYIAYHRQMLLLPLLLALAFSITIGSIVSPIGNPQNLLIALGSEVRGPFLLFFQYLFVPTVLNLCIVYYYIRWKFPDLSGNEDLKITHFQNWDKRLTKLCFVTTFILIGMIAWNVVCSLFSFSWQIDLIFIALIPACLILFFSKKRFSIAREVDWHTLIFFMAMFVLIQSVFNSLVIENWSEFLHVWVTEPIGILLFSMIGSQIISNVPFVALFLPMFSSDPLVLASLAAGSALAGNLLIFGAASNVIIIQRAEKAKKDPVPFFSFAKIGIPLALTNLFVYWLYFFLVF